MILPIVQHPDPVLRQICEPVEQVDDEIRTLIANMFETMYDAPGRGLAGPQVGVPKRLFVMDVDWKEDENRNPIAMINPEIVSRSSLQQSNMEGCLSILDHPVSVTRPKAVEMRWLDENGSEQQRCFADFAAVCICHEYDHLEGRLILDYEGQDEA